MSLPWITHNEVSLKISEISNTVLSKITELEQKIESIEDINHGLQNKIDELKLEIEKFSQHKQDTSMDP